MLDINYSKDSKMSFQNRSDLLRLKRQTLPVYRDIRDRPVWELMDVYYYNLIINPDLVDVLALQSTVENDIFYILFTRLYRLNSLNQYVWDGSVVNIRGFLFGTNISSDPDYNRFEDLRISTPNNTQQLNCYAHWQEPVYDEFTTYVPQVVFTMEAATGTWSGATNAVITYDNTTGWRTVRVYRGLN